MQLHAIARVVAALAALVAVPALAHVPAIRVLPINDHIWCFYDGRPEAIAVNPAEITWDDAGANNVGVATYAIHSGDTALVWDAYPSVAQARWVRDWLAAHGIRHFLLVNSHWHLDHVGGNAVYGDSPILATEATRQTLIAKRAAIESGHEWGPPAISPLVVPTIGIAAATTVQVGAIAVELRPVNIHSADGLVAYLPADKLLLAGDTLEDTVTFVSEPEGIPQQYRNLAAMRTWGFDHILPNHGDPAVIARGGYGLALIDATRAYLRALVMHAHDADFLDQPIEPYIADAVKAGTISLWWVYGAAHHDNLAKVSAAWKDKPLPDFGP